MGTILRGLLGLVVLIVVVVGGYLIGFHLNMLGHLSSPGTIEGAAIPQEVILGRRDAQTAAAEGLGFESQDEILFGDFHVHTTYSTDAFLWSLPMLGGTGAHPIADACDFARYCSGLDFWASTDHAEAISPRVWRDIRDSVNQCQAVSGDPENPDLVSFIGFEWTQVGRTPEDHYGHKNVIFEYLDDAEVSARPIAAAGVTTQVLRYSMPGFPAGIVLREGMQSQPFYNFNRFLAEIRSVPECDADAPSAELPDDCFESAATPGDLFARLDSQGLDPLVIPHGTSWGFYTPPGTTWDKQLVPDQHPEEFRLIEVYSGHGNSEEYRPWRAVNYDPATQTATCPEPSDNYLPSCWQAGNIIMQRCTDAGMDQETCEAAAAQARDDYANMGVAGHMAIQGESPEDWLNSGQCQDCFQPAFNMRPGTSVQYGLAISNFDNGADNPTRFEWGFIGSSDNHSARPGTGYKEVDRLANTEAGGPINETWRQTFVPQEDPSPVSHRMTPEELTQIAGFQLTEMERQASFWLTGGLAAVHSEGRTREQIWDALQRRETYATSGPRILLWFDLVNGDDGSADYPMGAALDMDHDPTFRVRAVGSFKQKEGCPDFAEQGLDAHRIADICSGECYNPSDDRYKITRIEIVRIRPQVSEGEDVRMLVEDPFLTLDCPDTDTGCEVEFSDPEYTATGRDTLYYARAIQEPTMAINADNLRCEYDSDGNCIAVNPCWGDYRTASDDDCLAATEQRAWASPIYLSYVTPATLDLTGGGPMPVETPTEDTDGTDEEAMPEGHE